MTDDEVKSWFESGRQAKIPDPDPITPEELTEIRATFEHPSTWSFDDLRYP